MHCDSFSKGKQKDTHVLSTYVRTYMLVLYTVLSTIPATTLMVLNGSLASTVCACVCVYHVHTCMQCPSHITHTE